jgi:dihydroorotase
MWFKNIRLIDDNQDYIGDICFENGIIVAIGKQICKDPHAKDFSKLPHLILLPAFTDLHAHFRDPGFTYKEDLHSGSRAALKGGYTAVNLMPNTKPVCSTMEIVHDVESRGREIGLITINQTLSMTKNLQGIDYEHLKSLESGEVLFVTDDGRGVRDDIVMRDIFTICKDKKCAIMCHAEDPKYSKIDMRIAENNMTFRDIHLFKEIGGHLHFCHVSTKEAIAAIRKAQEEGHNVSCEVTPHHIFATGNDVNHYRVNPPFRENEDINALIQALQDGVACAIATDHAPHTKEEKEAGAPGMIGLELAFPLCFTKLVKNKFLTLSQLADKMATTPSKMMHLNKGKLVVGMEADFAIFDIENPFTIFEDFFESKSVNSPFIGTKLYGKIIKTIRKGIEFDW